MARNLVLTGFSGTGKTTVGRLVAARLGREWIDMDQVIAAREKLTIPEIFSTHGEEHFRRLETALCQELASRNDLVISTGGGTIIGEENRKLFSDATILWLDASVETILTRLDGALDRPLLAGSREEEVKRLYALRRPVYSRVGHRIDTDGLTVEAVASEVLEEVERAATLLHLGVAGPGGHTPILIGNGLLSEVGLYLSGDQETARCAVVSNPTVSRLYGPLVLSSLAAASFDPVLFEIGDGEQYKTLDTVSRLYDRFVEARLERRSLVIALGGGVVGDVAGFAAATFMRGLPFVQVPTTLLAMVDAALGGKVGVDHARGKNLIGAFKFPRAILVDPLALQTLPAAEYLSGLSEVFKHAVIGDPGLFDSLDGRQIDAEGIARAMRVKIRLVEQDPYEDNVRAHLNLGHTFGHALESLSGYFLRHGQAVAMGIAVAARLAARIGCCPNGTTERILNRMVELGLPTRVPGGTSALEIYRAMWTDKKVQGGKLRLVLPFAIGRVEIVEGVGEEQIRAALADSGAV